MFGTLLEVIQGNYQTPGVNKLKQVELHQVKLTPEEEKTHTKLDI